MVEILRVFVASTSEFREEREHLKQQIEELNVLWASRLGIVLQLVGWETHTYPGISTEPQAVIDGQIGEYDIFVGLLWTRFGTPTTDAGSGTEHEFERAYERFRMYPDKIRIMIYFKDAPVNPTDIDPTQLAKVRGFKTRVSKLGAYYWSYKSGNEFGNLVRMHLTRQVQEFRKSWGIETASSASTPVPAASPSAEVIAARSDAA